MDESTEFIWGTFDTVGFLSRRRISARPPQSIEHEQLAAVVAAMAGRRRTPGRGPLRAVVERRHGQ